MTVQKLIRSYLARKHFREWGESSVILSLSLSLISASQWPVSIVCILAKHSRSAVLAYLKSDKAKQNGVLSRRQRYKVLKEFEESERSYVQALATLRKVREIRFSFSFFLDRRSCDHSLTDMISASCGLSWRSSVRVNSSSRRCAVSHDVSKVIQHRHMCMYRYRYKQ
jgi:hypothetical protein